MIEKATFQFIAELKQNNTKEWFDANRKRYDVAKANVIEFTAALISEVGKFDAGVKNLDAKKCVMRINRDVRFSANKMPYKNNFGVGISAEGKAVSAPGCYLHIEPEACFTGGGLWMPPADQLKKIRQEIDYNGETLTEFLESKAYKKHYKGLDQSEILKTTPKGYTPDNKHIDLLRLKSFVSMAKLTEEALQSKNSTTLVAEKWEANMPLIMFLREAISS